MTFQVKVTFKKLCPWALVSFVYVCPHGADPFIVFLSLVTIVLLIILQVELAYLFILYKYLNTIQYDEFRKTNLFAHKTMCNPQSQVTCTVGSTK